MRTEHRRRRDIESSRELEAEFKSGQRGPGLSHALAAVFFVISTFFVYRSFYGMRIESK